MSIFIFLIFMMCRIILFGKFFILGYDSEMSSFCEESNEQYYRYFNEVVNSDLEKIDKELRVIRIFELVGNRVNNFGLRIFQRVDISGSFGFNLSGSLCVREGEFIVNQILDKLEIEIIDEILLIVGNDKNNSFLRCESGIVVLLFLLDVSDRNVDNSLVDEVENEKFLLYFVSFMVKIDKFFFELCFFYLFERSLIIDFENK